MFNWAKGRRVGTAAGVVATVFTLVTALSYAVNTPTSSAATETSCTPNAILVNPCHPLLGAAAVGNPEAPADKTSQFNYLSSLTGQQMQVFRDFNANGALPLNANERQIASQPGTTLDINWKPAADWASADGGNATVNAAIDQAAANIKSLGSYKVFLTVWHEPQNDVTPGTSNCPNLKGSAGSPAQYIAMWNNVETRFKAAGVTNVVWAMNYQGYAAFNCLIPQLWPGNDAVDWVFYDTYDRGTKDTFAYTAGEVYNVLEQDNSATFNVDSKPWRLGEFGTCTNTDETNARQYYVDAKNAYQAGTYPRLHLWNVYADTGGPDAGSGCLTDYDNTGAKDTVKQANFNALAAALINTPIAVTTTTTAKPVTTTTVKPATTTTVAPPTTTTVKPTTTTAAPAACVGTQAVKNVVYKVNGKTVSTLTNNVVQGAIVQVSFQLQAGCTGTPIGVAAYDAPSSQFNPATDNQQVLVDHQNVTTKADGTTHTIQVTAPNCYFQVDFFSGYTDKTLGATHNYSLLDRLIASGNGGSQACKA